MKSVERSILINTSPQKIWDMLSADKLPEWQNYFKKLKTFRFTTPIEKQSDMFKVGAHAIFDKTCHHEVADSIKNEKLTYRIYEKALFFMFDGFATYSITALDDGVRFTYTNVFHKPTGVIGWFFDNYFLRTWVSNMIDKEMARLKTLTEH